jgi:hypothetical protein
MAINVNLDFGLKKKIKDLEAELLRLTKELGEGNIANANLLAEVNRLVSSLTCIHLQDYWSDKVFRNYSQNVYIFHVKKQQKKVSLFLLLTLIIAKVPSINVVSLLLGARGVGGY